VQKLNLLDHVRGLREEKRRDFKAKCLGGFEIDDKVERGRLLYRQISWLCTFQDFVDEGGSVPEEDENVRAVGYQPTLVWKFAIAIRDWETAAGARATI
jgi:hypothetical protein